MEPDEEPLYSNGPVPQKILREADAARYLCISRRKLRQIRAEGQIPYVRISSGLIHYEVSALDSFIAEHRQTS